MSPAILKTIICVKSSVPFKSMYTNTNFDPFSAVAKKKALEEEVEKRGKVVAAKFMEQKQSVKNLDGLKKIESMMMSVRSKVNGRGMSLGLSEIVVGAGFQRPKGQEFKLSLKSRKTVSRVQAPKQAATTVGGSKRPVKKQDKVLASIGPKKLFKDGAEKSVPAKKTPFKPGRVVPSRYNQIGNSAVSDGWKRSWPDEDKDDSKRGDKRRVSLVGKPYGIALETSRSQGSECRVKKSWEIPSKIVVYQGAAEHNKSPSVIAEIGDVLPKIKTVRCGIDTPRGSGPAKRVAELVGMKSYFSTHGEVCQELSFAEEDAEEE
ncbi:hypothetical protein ACFXTO_014654 [Malus domestica]